MAVKWLKVALENMATIADYIAQDKPDRPTSFVREIREKRSFWRTFQALVEPGASREPAN